MSGDLFPLFQRALFQAFPGRMTHVRDTENAHRLWSALQPLIDTAHEAGAAEVRARVEALADLWAGSDPDREFILGDEYAADLRAALNGGE